ncbi:MAG: peptidoglycan-binding protein [Christensenellales bacterium]
MSKMINFARLQVGKPYVFRASGPAAFDCSGLTKRAAAQIGLDLYHGATTQFNRGTATGPPERYGYFDQTGPIETLPTDRVAFLFNQDKTAAKLTMAHTGLYDGHGRVVQAGGRYKGVSDKPLDKRHWTHWARLKPEWEALDMAEIDSYVLRRRDKGALVKTLQEQLIKAGFPLPQHGADGDFGAETLKAVQDFQVAEGLLVDGVWDKDCQLALEKRLAGPTAPDEPVDEVTIVLPRSVLDALKTALNRVV